MGLGFPAEEIIDQEKIEDAFHHSMARTIKDKTNRLFNYGSDRGDKGVIDVLSSWYSKKIGCKIDPKNLYTTYGATYSLLISVIATLKRDDNVLMECPSYFLAAQVFYDQGINLIPAARDNNGNFEFDKLEKSIIENNIKGFYLVTNYHNPLGVNMTLENRCKLYELAHKHKFYVFSDDLYELLYFEEESRKVPLFFCDERTKSGRTDHLSTFDNNLSPFIISINSFNKCVCPSMRYGFLYAHTDVIEKILKVGIVSSASGFNSLNHHLVASYIELGYLDSQLEIQRKWLKTNMNIALELFKECKLVKFNIPEGGYFIFLELDKHIDVEKLHSLKEKYDISFVNGLNTIPKKLQSFFPEYKHTIRISISFLDKDTLKEAIQLFIKMLTEAYVE